MQELIFHLRGFKIFKRISIFIFVFIAISLYFPNFSKLKNIEKTNETLLLKITALKKEISDLEEKMKNINKDHFFLEKFARDNLGAARENEIVIDIKE